MPDSCVKFAWEFDGKGGGKALKGTDVAKQLKAKKLAWVHLNANETGTRAWLEKQMPYLDVWVVDALVATETRPRMVELEQGMLLILRGMNFNEGADIEDMIAIRIWADSNRIVTVERRRLRTVEALYNKLENGKGGCDAGDFVTHIAQEMANLMQPVIREMDEKVDDAEEEVMLNPSKEQRQTIVDIRRQAIMFRRHISPQRDVMQQMRNSSSNFIFEGDRRRAQETYQQLTRYVEDLDTIRERAQIVKDELTTTLSDKLNHNLYVLSVVAAVFLPLSFFTGLMGINIGGMPGVEDADAFWIFCGVLTLITLIQIVIFKKLKWF